MLAYIWGENNIFLRTEDVLEGGQFPMRSTLTKPMSLKGDEVARWTGREWEKLAKAPEVEQPGESLAEAKRAATEQNSLAYENAMALMTSEYPAAEIQTWERQRAEVVAWEADKDAATPWIDTAANIRQIDRTEYLTRTLAKVNAFAVASAYLTGKRQYFGDLISAATEVAQINAINFDYSLPGA